MKKVLVVCIGNSCRSQMAEAYLQFYGKGKAQYFSAGLYPNDIHPLTTCVMAEDNIDISSCHSKAISNYSDESFDYLLLLCEEISTQVPHYIRHEHLVKMFVPDPAAFVGSPEATLEAFREVRELVKAKILKFIGQSLILRVESQMQEQT